MESAGVSEEVQKLERCSFTDGLSLVLNNSQIEENGVIEGIHQCLVIAKPRVNKVSMLVHLLYLFEEVPFAVVSLWVVVLWLGLWFLLQDACLEQAKEFLVDFCE